MKLIPLFLALLTSTAFTTTAAFANGALEADLTRVDSLLSERSFADFVRQCDQKVTYSQMNPDTREISTFKLKHTSCENGKILMKVKRASGKMGARKSKLEFTEATFNQFSKNPLRELLQELTKTSYMGQRLTMDAFSFHELKESKTSLRTKNGYEDFDSITAWLLIDTYLGEQQLHVTLANDPRLSAGARVLEVFIYMTPILSVTAAE
jgi:hypothetical protein